jgi:hypothetical protein
MTIQSDIERSTALSESIKSAAENCVIENSSYTTASNFTVEAGYASASADSTLLCENIKAVAIHDANLLMQATNLFQGTDSALALSLLETLR